MSRFCRSDIYVRHICGPCRVAKNSGSHICDPYNPIVSNLHIYGLFQQPLLRSVLTPPQGGAGGCLYPLGDSPTPRIPKSIGTGREGTSLVESGERNLGPADPVGETGRHPSKGRPKAGVAATQSLGRRFSREPGCRPVFVKREWGLPVVPIPGSRTQTLSKERYSLLHHEGSNQRATPFSTLLPFPSLASDPGAVKPRKPEASLLFLAATSCAHQTRRQQFRSRMLS